MSGTESSRLRLGLLHVCLVFSGASMAGCTVSVPEPDLAGQDVHLTIIHTADIHSRLFPYQFAPGAIDKGLGLTPTSGDIAIVGGIARMATVIKQQRAASDRVIHLDSGDIFEGAPVFNTFNGEVEMRAMSRLGVSAMALGNHEFDKGSVDLELMKEQFGAFPILAANYIFADPSDPTQPKLRDVIGQTAIFNVQGLRVGVIGMGNLSSLEGIINGSNSLGVQPIESNTAVRRAVDEMRGYVDVVVMLSHLGLDEDEGVAQTSDVADQNPVVDGVDVILGGHLHIVLNPPKFLPRTDENGNPTGNTVLCHSGAFAKYVGRLDLSIHVADPKLPNDRSGVKSYTYTLFPITDAIPEDPDMVNLLYPYQFKMNQLLDLTHNYAVVSCPDSAAVCPKLLRSDPSNGDSQVGNLVAASMRFPRSVEANFGLTNSLGIRADFESGPLNLEEMYNVFPFDNTITTMYLSGNEIQEMMDFVAARSADRGCIVQSQVSGIWSVLDCTNRAGCGPFDQSGKAATACNHLTPGYSGAADGNFLLGDDCLNHPEHCQQVLPSGEYRVAVNDYIAAGGSGFAVLARNTSKFNTGISLREALIDYIVEQPNRCDATSNSNISQVLCKDMMGNDVDCTAQCCRDANGPLGCDTASVAFDLCFQQGRQPRIAFDYANLPCLDSTVEPHDGRLHMVGGN